MTHAYLTIASKEWKNVYLMTKHKTTSNKHNISILKQVLRETFFLWVAKYAEKWSISVDFNQISNYEV